jgi:hypothetical protein
VCVLHSCLKFDGWRFQGFQDAKIASIEGIVIGLLEKRPLLSMGGGGHRYLPPDRLAQDRTPGRRLAFTAMTGIPTADQSVPSSTP